MMRKLLILLPILAMMGCDQPQRRGGGEPIVPEGEVTQITLTVVMHDTYDDLRRENEMDDVDGLAHFSWDPEANESDCEVHIVRPEHVDDYESETLGHEVLHCVFGLYHR